MSHANATPPAAPIYDYIIAGAGGAGLSLLHYLLSSPVLSNKQIWQCYWGQQYLNIIAGGIRTEQIKVV